MYKYITKEDDKRSHQAIAMNTNSPLSNNIGVESVPWKLDTHTQALCEKTGRPPHKGSVMRKAL